MLPNIVSILQPATIYIDKEDLQQHLRFLVTDFPTTITSVKLEHRGCVFASEDAYVSQKNFEQHLIVMFYLVPAPAGLQTRIGGLTITVMINETPYKKEGCRVVFDAIESETADPDSQPAA